MKNIFVAILFSLFALCAADAQEFILHGRVVDAVDVKEALPSASVKLLSDTLVVAKDATDADGNFRLAAPKAGKYTLQVSFVGYVTLSRKVELTGSSPKTDLGTLLLKHDEKLLKELLVSGLAQELTIKADTFVYHSNAFRVPEGSTVAALIKQLPGLSMDADGNLTFQGKAVNSILVNGKPFLGDANTAMSNIISDAVEDIAVYEKSDEDKEFSGVHDTEKATVVDLKIKKEYMSSWNVNADAGIGTHDKYIAKLFASNFTDRRRTAVYAQMNNISENQVVDENGNWRSGWGFSDGIYTYRKAGAIMSWDNGRKNTEAGHLELHGEVEVGHDNSIYDNITNVENIIPVTGNHYSYGRTRQLGCEMTVSVSGGFILNIDSLNRLKAKISYGYNDSRNDAASSTSTYSGAVDSGNPETGLLGDDVPIELLDKGINSQSGNGKSVGYRNDLSAQAAFMHRFKREGYSLNIDMTYDASGHDYFSDRFSRYRYFNSDEPEVVERRYSSSPSDVQNFKATATLEGRFSETLRFSADYAFSWERNLTANSLYMLERFPYYAQQGLSLGIRPSTADSLAAVIDHANSYNSVNTDLVNSGRFFLVGVWDKFEATAGATLLHHNERLDYVRGEERYSPERGYLDFSPMARLLWRPLRNSELSLSYYMYTNRPSLIELLPVTDTSDEMVERVNNPALKVQKSHYFNMFSNLFNDKRGDTYHFYAYLNLRNNNIVNIIETDPQTGRKRHTKDNVNGCWYAGSNIGTEQPLDKERKWKLSAGAGYGFNQYKSYVGAMGDKLGLAVVRSHSPSARLGLKWRSGIWSVNLHGSYSGDYAVYDNLKEYNQCGHTFECNLEPQVDLPFGMKINSSFGLYGRRGYADEIMNHDQWLWNLSVSQSLLKSKALTLQLEAVDILNQRTSEYSRITPEMRHFSRNEVFLSYVLFHAIYRFNIGGK